MDQASILITNILNKRDSRSSETTKLAKLLGDVRNGSSHKSEFLQEVGRSVNQALTPSKAQQMFMECSGVVFLNAPEPEDLKKRYLPAFDKFLISLSINWNEKINVEEDSRKFYFVQKVNEMREKFIKQVDAVHSLSVQFNEGLESLLHNQGQIRPVSKDEFTNKSAIMYERFDKLLANYMIATQEIIHTLQKKFMSVYSSDAVARSARTQPLFRFGDDMWKHEKQILGQTQRKTKQSTRQVKIDNSYLEEYDDSEEQPAVEMREEEEEVKYSPRKTKRHFADEEEEEEEDNYISDDNGSSEYLPRSDHNKHSLYDDHNTFASKSKKTKTHNLIQHSNHNKKLSLENPICMPSFKNVTVQIHRMPVPPELPPYQLQSSQDTLLLPPLQESPSEFNFTILEEYFKDFDPMVGIQDILI